MISPSPPHDRHQPSPHEIKEACEVIQAVWSPRIRAKRQVGGTEPWLAKTMRWSDIGGDTFHYNSVE